MQALGIQTGADLRAQDLKFLERHFGRSARYYYWASRGRDERPVRANALHKSIGAERTFFTDLLEKGELLQALEPIIEEVWQRVRSEERRVGKSVSVRVDLGGRRIIKKKKKKD